MSWTCAICKKHLPKTTDIYQCWHHRLPDMMEKYGFKPGQIVCLEGCSERLEAEQDILVVKRNAEAPKIALFTDIFTDFDRRKEEEREKVLDEILRELSGDGVVGVRQEGSTLIVERGTAIDVEEQWARDSLWNMVFPGLYRSRISGRLSLKLGFLWDRVKAVKEVIFETKTMVAIIMTLWTIFWLVGVPVGYYYIGMKYL